MAGERSRPVVSVIVPTHERPELLREALASVRRVEGADLVLDVVVIDSGSPAGGVAEIAGEYGARCLRADAAGPSAARNVGLRAARGEFIAFLDDDDVWLDGHLRPHLEELRARPELGAVLGQIVSCDFLLRQTTVPWPDPFPAGRTSFARVFGYFPQLGATVVRASAAAAVGGFDDSLIGDEDWDWQLRVALAHEVAFVRVPCVKHRNHPDGLRARDDLHWARMRDFDRAFWRNVARAGGQRPSWPAIARSFLRSRGQFARHFLDSASALAQAGERAQARRALARAFGASPSHGLVRCATQPAMRRAVALAVAGGRP